MALTRIPEPPRSVHPAAIRNAIRSIRGGIRYPIPASELGQDISAPPPPTSPPPSGHWQNPDWQALIQADPGYIQGMGNITAQETTLGEQRARAIKQALIQFGLVPQGYASKYGDVAQADIDAAKGNKFSTIATLADQYARGQQDLSAALASRGILSSGALTGGNQALTTAHDRAVSEATNALLGALYGYEGGYASQYGALEGQRSNLYGDIGSRVAQMYQPTWIQDAAAAAPPAPPPLLRPPTTHLPPSQRGRYRATHPLLPEY